MKINKEQLILEFWINIINQGWWIDINTGKWIQIQ